MDRQPHPASRQRALRQEIHTAQAGQQVVLGESAPLCTTFQGGPIDARGLGPAADQDPPSARGGSASAGRPNSRIEITAGHLSQARTIDPMVNLLESLFQL